MVRDDSHPDADPKGENQSKATQQSVGTDNPDTSPEDSEQDHPPPLRSEDEARKEHAPAVDDKHETIKTKPEDIKQKQGKAKTQDNSQKAKAQKALFKTKSTQTPQATQPQIEKTKQTLAEQTPPAIRNPSKSVSRLQAMRRMKPKRARFTETVPLDLMNHFFRDQYRKVQIAFVLIAAANLICLVACVMLLFNRPSNIAIPSAYTPQAKNHPPASSDYMIFPRIAINKPNMTAAELNQWLINALEKAFSYSSQTYEYELNTNKTYFTANGWEEYKNVLLSMVKFESLTSREGLVSILHPTSAPVLQRAQVFADRFTWIFKVPTKITFAGSIKINSPQLLTLTVKIVRTSMENDVVGVKIDSIKTLRKKHPKKKNRGLQNLRISI